MKMPGYYRKKAVTIQAMQFHMLGKSGKSNYPDVVDWITRNGGECFVREPHQIIIKTLESNEFVSSVGDWIIRGVKGEFYACKPDIFEQTYDEARGHPYDRPEHSAPHPVSPRKEK